MTQAYRAVERLYHAFLTGLLLTTVTRRSASDAAELTFRTFRRQHLEKFLPGLEKLGLTHLPHAVAAEVAHQAIIMLFGHRLNCRADVRDTRAGFSC